ncbi:hypothetical protein [Burkholderia cepacia]|uniref:Uncharacterized protein n=1 Tax=Burkholderia cepacia GG4 TaxID=1009846 RepID=A0A9W3PB98_BURCE|nr:hypothetical protein [Burkholderia cepacia]AFQ50411.1 hypothetical protein GEM_4021 [Burkholderia cepacia GG4]
MTTHNEKSPLNQMESGQEKRSASEARALSGEDNGGSPENLSDKSRADALTDLLKSIATNLNAGLPGIALTRAEAALELLAASHVEQPEKSPAPLGGSEAAGRRIQANCPTSDIFESPPPSNNREFPTSISENDCEHRIALAPSQPAAAPIRDLIANDAYAMSFETMGQYRAALLAECDAPVEQPAAAPNPDTELGAFVRRLVAALADSPKSFLANVQRAIEDQASATPKHKS